MSSISKIWEAVRRKGYVRSPDAKPGQVPVMAEVSDQGVRVLAGDTDITDQIGSGGSSGGGSVAVAVPTGYTVDVSGTSEVLLCAGPCDVAQLLHSKTAGATITLKDAGTTGTAAAALKTVDMASTSQLQMAVASGTYGITATLSGGSATFLIRPKA